MWLPSSHFRLHSPLSPSLSSYLTWVQLDNVLIPAFQVGSIQQLAIASQCVSGQVGQVNLLSFKTNSQVFRCNVIYQVLSTKQQVAAHLPFSLFVVSLAFIVYLFAYLNHLLHNKIEVYDSKF